MRKLVDNLLLLVRRVPKITDGLPAATEAEAPDDQSDCDGNPHYHLKQVICFFFRQSHNLLLLGGGILLLLGRTAVDYHYFVAIGCVLKVLQQCTF